MAAQTRNYMPRREEGDVSLSDGSGGDGSKTYGPCEGHVLPVDNDEQGQEDAARPPWTGDIIRGYCLPVDVQQRQRPGDACGAEAEGQQIGKRICGRHCRLSD